LRPTPRPFRPTYIDTGTFLLNLRRMLKQECLEESVHVYADKTINSRVNAERDELVQAVMELHIEVGNDIIAAGARGGISGAVEAAIRLTRARVAALITARIVEE
jgi:hypothetical protein